ncbi:carbonic anhydrase-like [Anoplolepis gracilipes]|uniref:carbonic anhydrase-like n=1 Tax=Anoplolepis gracilipes TaxID=354296 RepID=UPI003BA2C249
MIGVSRVKMDLNHLLITLTLFFIDLKIATAANWGYCGKNGPENWPGICKTGKKQSPIDIVTEDAIKTNLGALKFDGYDLAFPATLKNNGHSVGIDMKGVPSHLSGANLQSVYVLDHLHFHWGSEHTINGLRNPLELHIVHYNSQYANLSVAARHENGIAVVSVLFKLDKYDNPLLKSIVKATKEVLFKVGKSALISGHLRPLVLLPKDHTTYYHYQGSLTTPACQESVAWFVLTEKLTVSKSQMNVFKHLRGDNGKLKQNYRPVQALNDRIVYHHLRFDPSNVSFNKCCLIYLDTKMLLN